MVMKKIAIQGIKGSYHHKVAVNYFGENIEIFECLSFDDVASSVISGKCELGVMAIENSIAGSIIPNYSIIDNSNLEIIGEYYFDINHQLLAYPGVEIKDLEFISSHPMALLQCKDFLKKNPKITLIEAKDTAKVAHEIKKNKMKNTGAIASIEAAELYSLDIICKNIQSMKNNETRFVFVSKSKTEHREEFNKASLKFILSHKTGSLANILNILSDHRLNLTKIQSLPVAEIPWKYSFFVDTTFDKIDDLNKALNLIKKYSDFLKVLGIYKNKNK